MHLTLRQDWNDFHREIEASSNSSERKVTYHPARGWHFYSMLKVRMDRQTGESSRDEARLISMYRNYTRAAVTVARNYSKTCAVLEHQGNVIHFYFPDTAEDEYSLIQTFAGELAALVDEFVIGYYDNDVLQFHMGAMYGRSVIIHSVSPEHAEWSNSTVSLGMAANEPAKQISESSEKTSRPLWWKRSFDSRWNIFDASSKDVGTRNARLGRFGRLGALRDFNRVVAAADRMPTVSCRAVESNPQEQTKVSSRIGYFFRADMDGFTRRVEEAFKAGKVGLLVQQFIAYMDSANKWVVATELGVVVHPWAGDCYNALILPSMGEQWRGGTASMASYPRTIVLSWQKAIANSWRSVKWVYALSFGEVKTFGVDVDNRKFKLSVGAPAGKTQVSVNFSENKGGWLVMPKDEAVRTRLKFDIYPDSRHKNFRWHETSMDAAGKSLAIAAAATMAKPQHSTGYELRETRPWACK